MKAVSIRKLCVPAMLIFVFALAAPMFGQDSDPPNRVARLSYVSGSVSFQPSGEDQWSQATLNYPLTTGDRVFTDQDSRAELETGNIAMRLSSNTDLTTTNINDQMVQLGIAQGTLRVRAYDIREGNSIEIDTPTAALTLLRPGSYRVEVYPDDATTLVTVNDGDLQINGSDFSQTVHSGQAVRLSGADQVRLDFVSAPNADDFDRWSGDRDRSYLSSRSREYVGDYVPGYADLDEYGSWNAVPEYGQVWFPRSVDAGWVPYRYGHWAWVEPWGWTWVEDEPWGFAPFHYGRWVVVGARWGWVPGPVVVRPVYAPALVAFVGGGGVSFGVGVQCWFPLGPRDPYFPWYHHSDVYLRQVNVTNVTVRNVTIVNNYINRGNSVQVRYAYQRVAPTAVSTEAFRTSQPVGRQVVRVNVDDVARARVIPHPEAAPDHKAIVAGAPVMHPPVEQTRPFVEHRPLNRPFYPGNQHPERTIVPDRGTYGREGANQPGGQNPPAPDGRTFGGAGDRRTVQVPPPAATPQPEGRAIVPDRGTYQPPPGNQPNKAGGENPPSTGEDRTFHGPGDRRTANNPQGEQGNSGGAANNNGSQGNAGRPPFVGPPQRRPLVTNAPAPPSNPSFTQRQPALQEHPGRPLEPQQMQNLRQGQPAGASHDREYAPHPQQSAPKGNQHSDDHGRKEH